MVKGENDMLRNSYRKVIRMLDVNGDKMSDQAGMTGYTGHVQQCLINMQPDNNKVAYNSYHWNWNRGKGVLEVGL